MQKFFSHAEIRQIEKDIALEVSFFIKENEGKGPLKTKVTLCHNYILIYMEGLLTQGELEMAQDHENEVRHIRILQAKANMPKLIKTLEEKTGLKIKEFFYDVNILSNMAFTVMVME